MIEEGEQEGDVFGEGEGGKRIGLRGHVGRMDHAQGRRTWKGVKMGLAVMLCQA